MRSLKTDAERRGERPERRMARRSRSTVKLGGDEMTKDVNMETWQTRTDCATVRSGDTQADVAMWPNSEGVTVAVTGPHAAVVLAGSLRWEQMEALCAAFSLLKARGA